MGVWIETMKIEFFQRQREVTPCMGVWIETTNIKQEEKAAQVTPCMGVWIETFQSTTLCYYQ